MDTGNPSKVARQKIAVKFIFLTRKFLTMKKLLHSLLLVLFCTSLTFGQNATVLEIINNSPDHETLSTVLELSGLDGALADPNATLTVFAPTDDAFEAIDSATLAEVLSNPELLEAILLYHVVGSIALSSDLEDGMEVETLMGENVTVTINGGVFINNAQVTVADLEADNGVVHVINAVLLPPADEPFTVWNIIEESDDHLTLSAVLELSGLDAALANPDANLTVFAPTDDAFEAIDSAVLAEVLNDPELLEAILLYHVVGSIAFSTDLEDGMEIETLLGENVTVTINADGVFINDAQVTVADLEADNGVVHVIDAVLLPIDEPFTVWNIIDESEDHVILAIALEIAGLDNALNDPDATFTVFAPTDDAFEAIDSAVLAEVLDNPELLEAILLYHVVGSVAFSTDLEDGMEIETLLGENITVTINADGVFINDAQVTVADVTADNGVVHVIDAVLLPPADEAFTVMDIIENSADHQTLNTVLQLSGLDAALADPDATLTVFAPTDDAFDAIPEDVLQEVLNNPELLESILLYHVVGSVALSTDLSDGMEIETLLGENVTVTINADGVFINDAQVTVADLVADNGVVHVIDAVLLPPADEPFTVMDIINNSPDHETLATALEISGFDALLSLTNFSFTVFAPTDDAFSLIPEDILNEILNDPDLLDFILGYHVVDGVALSTDLEDGMEIETLVDINVSVTINADGIFINDAQVIVADLIADNGVVHVIDAVLLPGTAYTVADVISDSPDHTTLNAAITAAGLEGALSDPFATLTVFAPTDEAFNALPEGLLEELLDDPEGLLTDILLYHVVGSVAFSTDLEDGMEIETLLGETVIVTINAEGVFINDAQVILADIEADNGVVHVIDAVLSPPTSTENLTEVTANLFPNPATSQVNIQLPEALSDNAQVIITDIKGRVIQQFENNGIHINIEVGSYQAGTYFITIFNNEFIARQVFIKQ